MRNHRFTRKTGIGCGALGAFLQRRGKTGEIVLAVENEPPRLLVLQNVLHELRNERSETRIDFLDARFFRRRQPRPSANELEVMTLEHAEIFFAELQRFAPLIEIVDTLEEAFVEQNLRFMRREPGRHVSRNFL